MSSLLNAVLFFWQTRMKSDCLTFFAENPQSSTFVYFAQGRQKSIFIYISNLILHFHRGASNYLTMLSLSSLSKKHYFTKT